MHERIVRRISRTQFRTPFIIMLVLLGANLAFSAWHIWMRMADLETLSIFRALMEGFTWSTDFMEDFAATAHQFLPLSAIAIFLINAALVVYGIRIVKNFPESLVFPKRSQLYS